MTISKCEYIKLLKLKPSSNNNNNNTLSMINMKTQHHGPRLPSPVSPNDKDPPSGHVTLAGNGNQSFILVPQQQLQQNVILGQTVFQTIDGKKFVFVPGPNKKGLIAAKVNVHGNYADNVEADKQNIALLKDTASLTGNENKDRKDDASVVAMPTSVLSQNGIKKEEDDKNVIKRSSFNSDALLDCIKIEPRVKGKDRSSNNSSPVETKKRSKSKLPPNVSSKKVISLFRSDVPPPSPHTPESAICTFHEHTLVRMATRGFWGGDRGPIQDVFRTIRTDVGDQTFTVEDITRCCYNLVKQKLDQATSKETYYMYMKGYVDEFDGVMDRVYPVTTIAMMLYLPMAENYAATTWHGVPPTGWSEYRRAVIMREVFEVMFKFGAEQQSVPEYHRRYFEDTDASEELISRPYVSCWDCSAPMESESRKQHSIQNGTCEPITMTTPSPPATSPTGRNQSSALTPTDHFRDHTKPPSPSIITSQFAESIVSACSNSNSWTKTEDTPNQTEANSAGEQNSPHNTAEVETNGEEATALRSIKRSRYFAALWLGKAPKEAEILFEDGSLMKVSNYLEEYPLEKSSPPRDTKIIVDGKTYNARDVLGHFRRGVQLVEHSYNTVTNSNTTSTLKGTADGGIVRKVPPYKISKLIHPGLHLETYTSRILSIADEESGLVKRSIRRARSRFRRSTASPIENGPANTRNSTKRMRSEDAFDDSASSSPPPIKSFKSIDEHHKDIQMRDQCIQTEGGEDLNRSQHQSDSTIQNALLSAFMTSVPGMSSTRPHTTDVTALQSLIESYKKTGEFLISLAQNLQQALPSNGQPSNSR